MIYENYVLLSKISDFNNRLIHHFINRLSIFLCVDLNIYPKVIITNSIKTFENLYLGYRIDEVPKSPSCRAFFNEDNDSMVFNGNAYNRTNESFFIDIEKLKTDIDKKYIHKYKYIIPIADIYHESIHFFQNKLVPEKYMNWSCDDIIEASCDMYMYFLTGRDLDYEPEAMSLWYLSKYELNLKDMKFYMFIRDLIVDPNWEYKYLLNNKHIINVLSKYYKGDILELLKNIRTDFYYESLKDEFYKDMNNVHNLIFYKW